MNRPTAILGSIALLIVLNSSISVLSVQRAKKLEAPARQCAFEKWRWIGAMEQLEWNFHRWEMQAPVCLERGLPIVEKLEAGEGYRVLNFETAQVAIQDSTSSVVLVPSPHSFLSGQSLWLCGENQLEQATITSIALAGNNRTALTLDFVQKERAHAVSKGTLLVQTTLQEYRIVPRKDGSGFTLMSKGASESLQPIFTGITSFSISSTPLTPTGQLPISFQVKSDSCELNRNFTLTATYPNSKDGRWVVSGETIAFLPWLTPPPKEGP